MHDERKNQNTRIPLLANPYHNYASLKFDELQAILFYVPNTSNDQAFS